jgi:hypothetical protein
MKKILPPHPLHLWKGGIWGRGVVGDENGGCGNSRILKTPIKIGHLLGV